MKITHKMTAVDKLREILWVKKWKQKDGTQKDKITEILSL